MEKEFKDFEKEKEQKKISYSEVDFACRLHKIVDIGHRRFNLVIDAATPKAKGEILKKFQDEGFKTGIKETNDSVVFITIRKSDYWKLQDGEENEDRNRLK